MIADWYFWLLVFLLLLLIALLWLWLRWRVTSPPVVPPTGWLLEAWGRNDMIREECGMERPSLLYANLLARTLNVNMEAVNAGDCTVNFATTRHPQLLSLLPGARTSLAFAVPANDRLTFLCTRDASGNECKFHVRLQRI